MKIANATYLLISLPLLATSVPVLAAEKTPPVIKTVTLDGKNYTVEQKGKWAKSRFRGGIVVAGGPKQVKASVRAAEIASGCSSKGFADRNGYVDVLLDCDNKPSEPAPAGTEIRDGDAE